MNPSIFAHIPPINSVLCKREAEIVAQNIMQIRKRLGDKWDLKWSEYKRERIKDGSFTMSEKHWFDQVIKLIPDSIGAIGFSPSWTKAARKHQTTKPPTNARI